MIDTIIAGIGGGLMVTFIPKILHLIVSGEWDNGF